MRGSGAFGTASSARSSERLVVVLLGSEPKRRRQKHSISLRFVQLPPRRRRRRFFRSLSLCGNKLLPAHQEVSHTISYSFPPTPSSLACRRHLLALANAETSLVKAWLFGGIMDCEGCTVGVASPAREQPPALPSSLWFMTA